MNMLWISARSAAVCLEDGGLYAAQAPLRLFLNDHFYGEARTVVTSLFALRPDTEYQLRAERDGATFAELTFTTLSEFVTLDVHAFGAVGDGVHDDTAAIQAAISCCPERGRVLIPAGDYSVTSLFLKSHITLEITKGATLRQIPDRSRLPILPGMTQSWDEQSEYPLASWEGNPLSCFASLIHGVNVEDVRLIGEGLLDGQAQQGDWWQHPKQKRGAWRGHLLFLNRCKNICVQGLTFRNSPSWTIHPYFCEDIAFYNIAIEAPLDSPNTDGLNPESCRNVLIAGARFSLGDDCIAIKAGKLYMGRAFHTPCEHIEVAHCLMESGHGGVTIGSEMSGGVKDVYVHDCLMRHTDRGLRVKTRRGRSGVIDNIRFERVRMESVSALFTVNGYYACDPDGHTDLVQNRSPQPTDDGTPTIGSLSFSDIQAVDCQACAGYFLGLSERKIEAVRLENVSVSYAEDAKAFLPIMADGIEPCLKRGWIAENVEVLKLKNVTVNGHNGRLLDATNVDKGDYQ